MARFRDLSFVELFAIGFIVLVGCVAGLGGLILAGGMYFRSRPAPSPVVFPTITPFTSAPQPATENPAPPPAPGGPGGKIVYVCQLFGSQDRDQICIINADRTGQRRLTTTDTARHFYPSLSPDGESVLFSSNMNGNFEIYEQD